MAILGPRDNLIPRIETRHLRKITFNKTALLIDPFDLNLQGHKTIGFSLAHGLHLAIVSFGEVENSGM